MREEGREYEQMKNQQKITKVYVCSWTAIYVLHIDKRIPIMVEIHLCNILALTLALAP